MPLRQTLPASGAETAIHEIKNEEGVIVIGYNGTGTITIEFWDGTGWVQFRRRGEDRNLDTDNHIEKINGPAIYRFTKPDGSTLAVYYGTDTNGQLLESFP